MSSSPSVEPFGLLPSLDTAIQARGPDSPLGSRAKKLFNPLPLPYGNGARNAGHALTNSERIRICWRIYALGRGFGGSGEAVALFEVRKEKLPITRD